MSWFRGRLPPRESVLKAAELGRESTGDFVWYLQDGLISFANVIEARSHWWHMDADQKTAPPWFVLYKIRKCVSGTVIDTAHRSDLYLVASEREHLIRDLEELEDRARRYREELEGREPDYVPDPDKDDV